MSIKYNDAWLKLNQIYYSKYKLKQKITFKQMRNINNKISTSKNIIIFIVGEI